MAWKDAQGRPEITMPTAIKVGVAAPRVTARTTDTGELVEVDDDLASVEVDDAPDQGG